MRRESQKTREIIIAALFAWITGQFKNINSFRPLERRKYPRVQISIKGTRVDTGLFSYYQPLNISENGMFIKTLEPLPVGAKLQLKFSLGRFMDEVSVVTKVVRVRPYLSADDHPAGMGVKFVEITEAARQAIRSFVCARP